MSRLVDHSNSTIARMYRQNTIWHGSTRNSNSGTIVAAPHLGNFIALHSAAPPSVAEYEKWLRETVGSDNRGKAKIDARKLRRAVVMLRQGSSQADAGKAVGITAGCLMKWVRQLPEELAA